MSQICQMMLENLKTVSRVFSQSDKYQMVSDCLVLEWHDHQMMAENYQEGYM